MTALRSAFFWVFLLFWTFLVVPPFVVLSLLTLGRFRYTFMELAMASWSIPALWVAGVKLRVRGREHIVGRKPRILVFNHQSFLDMLIISAIHPPGACPLGKRMFVYVPVVGVAWWALGGRFVDRGDSKRARATLAELGRDMRKHGICALIAPEGTRSRSGALQPFKMGAFHLAVDLQGVPMVPVIEYGAWDLCHPDDWRIHPGVVDVVIHPEIDTSGWKKETLRQEAEKLHDWYAGRIEEGAG